MSKAVAWHSKICKNIVPNKIKSNSMKAGYPDRWHVVQPPTSRILSWGKRSRSLHLHTVWLGTVFAKSPHPPCSHSWRCSSGSKSVGMHAAFLSTYVCTYIYTYVHRFESLLDLIFWLAVILIVHFEAHHCADCTKVLLPTLLPSSFYVGWDACGPAAAHSADRHCCSWARKKGNEEKKPLRESDTSISESPMTWANDVVETLHVPRTVFFYCSSACGPLTKTMLSPGLPIPCTVRAVVCLNLSG